MNVGHCNYRFVTDLNVLMWIFEEHRFCCNIEMSYYDVGILFLKLIHFLEYKDNNLEKPGMI